MSLPRDASALLSQKIKHQMKTNFDFCLLLTGLSYLKCIISHFCSDSKFLCEAFDTSLLKPVYMMLRKQFASCCENCGGLWC